MPRTEVLVAQEESAMLDVIKIHLERAGFDSVQAQDGVQAFEALENGCPVAVILDLDLPRVSGFRLVKLMRRNPRWSRLPIIVASCYAFEEIEDLAGDGIDSFILKPFDPADLVDRLQLALARPRSAA